MECRINVLMEETYVHACGGNAYGRRRQSTGGWGTQRRGAAERWNRWRPRRENGSRVGWPILTEADEVWRVGSERRTAAYVNMCIYRTIYVLIGMEDGRRIQSGRTATRDQIGWLAAGAISTAKS
jgi:hypothetical protein